MLVLFLLRTGPSATNEQELHHSNSKEHNTSESFTTARGDYTRFVQTSQRAPGVGQSAAMGSESRRSYQILLKGLSVHWTILHHGFLWFAPGWCRGGSGVVWHPGLRKWNYVTLVFQSLVHVVYQHEHSQYEAWDFEPCARASAPSMALWHSSQWQLSFSHFFKCCGWARGS